MCGELFAALITIWIAEKVFRIICVITREQIVSNTFERISVCYLYSLDTSTIETFNYARYLYYAVIRCEDTN